MAKSYYGYAERNSDSQVNWAEIGKNMSDMLTETNRVREEKKDAIEKATREEFKRIADSPIGEHESARIAAIKLSDTAANQLRINNNLMKNGRMSVKDYTIFHQNISDNIDLAFNANKAYQENYAEISKRAANGDASALELLNAAQAEKFGDWSKMGWVISPNGTIMAGLKTKKEVGGKEVEVIDETPGNLASMQSLNGLLLTRIDKYKYEPLIDNFVNSLGEEITSELQKGTLTEQGSITSKSDIASREYLKPGTKEVLSRFIDAEDAKIKEIAGTDLDKARILLDSKRMTDGNTPYDVTNDPSEADRDPSKILRIYDQESGGYTYKISKEQDGEITKFLRDQMRAKYDRKVEKQLVSQTQRNDKPQYIADQEKADKEAKDAVTAIGQLWYGDNNQVDSASTYFKGLKNEKGEQIFQDIKRDGNGVTLIYFDGRKDYIKFKDANGKIKTQEDFIRSSGPLLTGQIDVSSALTKGSYSKGARFNAASIGRATTEVPTMITADTMVQPSQKAVVNLNASLPKDFVARNDDWAGLVGDGIIITAPDGTEYKTKSGRSAKGGDAATAAMGIEDFIKEQIAKKREAGTGELD